MCDVSSDRHVNFSSPLFQKELRGTHFVTRNFWVCVLLI